MEELRTYLNSLKPDEQESYAERSGTTLGYLRKVLSTGERMRESLAIALDRESRGAVPLDKVRPDVDWAYVRGTSRRGAGVTTRRRSA